MFFTLVSSGRDLIEDPNFPPYSVSLIEAGGGGWGLSLQRPKQQNYKHSAPCDVTVDILALSFIIVRTSLRVGTRKLI